ncbi:MAG: TAXI family TRAP transporter solute-binding subunit [Caldimonas sp.]
MAAFVARGVRLIAAASLLGALALAAVAAPAPYKIVTASERGTYIQIGRDISKFVAPAADIELEVLPSAGSAENVQRLRYEPGVKFALVQSDVYQAFLDQAAGGNAEAGSIIRPLRVIMPLYNEEIYFIARSDAPINFVHEIKEAKINVGPLRSGTAMSATTIYRQLFGAALPDANASFLSNEEALVKLVSDKSLDVVVAVAGQPFKLLVDMKPEARQLIKLLKFDSANPASAAALKTYFPTMIKAANYPNVLTEDIPGAAVKAFLVTYDYTMGGSVSRLRSFARSLCQNFPKLQAEGHPKWKEVQLATPELPRGWLYYPPMERELKSCIAGATGAGAARASASAPGFTCTQQAKVLGLCK